MGMNQVISLNINNEIQKIGKEFSRSTKLCLDGNEIARLTRITSIFILLNGATGAQVENIPLPLAGHFVIWCNNKIYIKLRLLRSEIQSYSRANQFTIRKINRIIEIFNSIYLCLNHMVFASRMNIPDEESYEDAKAKMERFGRYNIRNFNEFDQSSWKQWFE